MSVRSLLSNCLCFTIVLLRAGTSFADTPPRCNVEPEKNEEIRVSIPEPLRIGSANFQWQVEGMSMPETSPILSITHDPFLTGSFIVIAEDPSHTVLCQSTLNIQPPQVEHEDFIDPYPALDNDERHRFAVLREVVSDGVALRKLRGSAKVVDSKNDGLRQKIDDQVGNERITIGRIADIDLKLKNLADDLKRVATSLQEQNSTLRTSCGSADNRDLCELAPRYSRIDDEFADLARDAAILPRPPAQAAVRKMPTIALPPVPEQATRDMPLSTLEKIHREVRKQLADYPKFIAELRRQNKELRRSLDEVTSENKLEEERARLHEQRYDRLIQRGDTVRDASTQVSLEVERRCGARDEKLCQLFQSRAKMDAAMATALIRKETPIIFTASSRTDYLMRSSVISSPIKVKVFFATERAQVDGKTDFGDHRTADGSLRFGVATVTVPPTHEIGEIEGPVWWKAEFHRDPSKHFTLSAAIVSRNAFYGSVAEYLRDYCPKNKQVLVFVHGYDVSFDEAIFRAAQISVDTKFDGAPIVYDWPSWSSVADYPADKTSIISSVRNIENFLNEVASRTGATTINVIAHSMGNFGVLTALDDLVHTGQVPRINQLILAAPDIDIVRMGQIIPGLVATKKIGRITLYASSRDLALQASTKVNKVFPVGHVPPVNTFKGVDTIDASAIEGTFLGHDYFASTRAVLTDMYILLTHGSAPPRMGLEPVSENGTTHWRFVASAR